MGPRVHVLFFMLASSHEAFGTKCARISLVTHLNPFFLLIFSILQSGGCNSRLFCSGIHVFLQSIIQCGPLLNWTLGKGHHVLNFSLQEEFLLNGPTDVMGMFVTSEGTSQRAPLSWSERLLALGFSFPYVIALGASSISIHR